MSQISLDILEANERHKYVLINVGDDFNDYAKGRQVLNVHINMCAYFKATSVRFMGHCWVSN